MGKGDWKRPIDDKKRYEENYEAIFGKKTKSSTVWDPEDPGHPDNSNSVDRPEGEETPPVPGDDRVLPNEGKPGTDDDHSEQGRENS